MQDQHRHRSTRPTLPPTRAGAPSGSPGARTSTRPPTSSHVRPAPPRKGQPASSRNFAASSAGGAPSHLRETDLRDAKQSAVGTDARADLNDEQRAKIDQWGDSYVPSEETIRNDYSQEYVSSGARPQNFIRNAKVSTRFAEYPKLATLLSKKHSLTNEPRFSIPPTYLNLTAPVEAVNVALSPFVKSASRFDVILVTPPPSLSYDALSSLPLSSVASNPGFVFLWVGSGQKTFDPTSGDLVGTDGIGLERGRELLSTWGYRRCEDIVWLKTNRSDPQDDLTRAPTSLFAPSVEHCLMGIRGTVRRSTDSWFVHCNVDTDVIVWEGDDQDPDLKPPELQSLIENFCLGTRRLHLFGSKNSLRRGWLTVGSSADQPFGSDSKVQDVEKERAGTEWKAKAWDMEEWKATWEGHQVQQLLPFDEELDSLRPKSPPPRNGQPSSGGLGRGRGAGLGITRSGLVTQAVARGPSTSVPGAGRGRGTNASRSITPVAAANGYIFASSGSSSGSPARSSSSLPSSMSDPPYRGDPSTHQMPPAAPAPHPSLPSRPSFNPQRSAFPASPSNQFTSAPPPRYATASFVTHGTQPRPPQLQYPSGPFPPTGPQGYPPPIEHFYNTPSAMPQQYGHNFQPPVHIAPQQQTSLPSQFSHLSLSQQHGPYPIPTQVHPPPFPSSSSPYRPYAPSPSPQLRPPPPNPPYTAAHPTPYLLSAPPPAAAAAAEIVPHLRGGTSLPFSPSTSSLQYGTANGGRGGSGGGGGFERADPDYYPISSSRRPSDNGYSDGGGGGGRGVYADAL